VRCAASYGECKRDQRGRRIRGSACIRIAKQAAEMCLWLHTAILLRAWRDDGERKERNGERSGVALSHSCRVRYSAASFDSLTHKLASGPPCRCD
jgi:hypothetical protein